MGNQGMTDALQLFGYALIAVGVMGWIGSYRR